MNKDSSSLSWTEVEVMRPGTGQKFSLKETYTAPCSKWGQKVLSMKAEKPQSHSACSRYSKAAVFPRRWSAQPIALFLPPGLSWRPTAHHPTLPLASTSSSWPSAASCPWIVTEAYGLAPEGGWGAGCIHPGCFHLSANNTGPTVCQAPFRSVPVAS